MEGTTMDNKKRLSSSSQDSDDDDHHSKKRKLLSPLEEDNSTLPKILSYLNVKELKNCRLVCNRWAQEGGKHLLQKFGIRIGSFHPLVLNDNKTFENEKKEQAKEQANDVKKLLELTKSKSWTLQVQNSDMYQVIYKIPVVVNQVQKLVFNQQTGHYVEGSLDFVAQRNLLALLNKLPHLEVLETRVFVELVQDHVIFRESSPSTSKFQKFLKKIESLKELRLDFNQSPKVFRSLIRHPNSLKAIRRIQVNNTNRMEIPRILNMYVDHKVNWDITELSLTIAHNLSTNLSRKFFSRLSSTLRKLELKIDASSSSSFIVPPLRLPQPVLVNLDDEELEVESDENSFIPLSLKFLESLSITGNIPTTAQKFDLFNTLLVALRLPRIKKLVMGYTPFVTVKDLNWFDQHCGLRQIPNIIIIRRSSLEELELCGHARRFHEVAISMANKSRRLTALKMDLPYPDDFPESFFNCRLTKLERLDLTLDLSENWGSANVSLYEEWLTGVQRPNDYQGGEIPYIETTGTPHPFYFRHLQNLKHLTFRGPRESNLKPPFTDFLIYNGFMLMKNLQSLNFYNVEFGADALEDLKNSLGIYACITFENTNDLD